MHLTHHSFYPKQALVARMLGGLCGEKAHSLVATMLGGLCGEKAHSLVARMLGGLCGEKAHSLVVRIIQSNSLMFPPEASYQTTAIDTADQALGSS